MKSKHLDKLKKGKKGIKLQKNMWGGQGVGWSHLRGPCRRKKPLPLARVEVAHRTAIFLCSLDVEMLSSDIVNMVSAKIS